MDDKSILKNRLKYLEKSGVLKNRTIYVGPASDKTVVAVDLLNNMGYKVSGIIDDNIIYNNQCLCGVNIAPVEEYLIPYRKEKIFLMTDITDKKLQLKCDFLEYWYNEGRFNLYEINKTDCFAIRKTKKLLQNLATKVRNSSMQNFKVVRNGYKCYRRIKREYNAKEKSILIFPHRSLGDIYWLGLFKKSDANEFKKDYVLVVIGEACKAVAIEMGFSSVISISQNEMNALYYFVNLLEGDLHDIKVIHFDYIHTSINPLVIASKDISFINCYEKLVFDKECSKEMCWSMPRHDICELIKKYNVTHWNSVILAPSAKSIPQITPVFWEYLASQLKMKGFRVFTNVSGEEEKAIHGTEAIECTISEINSLLEYAGYFVGIRSGICDVVSSSNCKKVILYPPKDEKGLDYMKYYSMSQLIAAHSFIEEQIPLSPSSQEMQKIVNIIINDFEGGDNDEKSM